MAIYQAISGQGENLVTVHGWAGCDHRHMQPIVDQLSPHYRVTNIDLPGCGKSPWAANITNIHDMADLLIPHLPEQAIYIAWSFGGLITTSIAARYPDRVKHFIGIGTMPKFIEDDGWPGVAKPGFKANFSQIKELGYQAFFQGFYETEFADFDPQPKAYLKLKKLLESVPEQDLDILLAGVNIADVTDLREEFKSLSCPIDLILGGRDAAIPNDSPELIKQLNPRVNIHTIANAQHMPFWTHQKEFQAILKKIL
jgi:pimeloyl-[acyl-carrier protein] methyl ester esterase